MSRCNFDKFSIADFWKNTAPFPEQSFNFPKWENFTAQEDKITVQVCNV